MLPTLLVGLSLVPFALALAIIVAGRPTHASLRWLIVVTPLQAFGVIEAGFTIPIAYLVLVSILVGILLKGEFVSSRLPGCRLVLVYWSVALIATVAAWLFSQGIAVHLAENMRFRAGPLRSPLQYGLLLFHFSLFFLIVNYVKTRNDADQFMKTHLWVGFSIIMLGIVQMAAYLSDFPIQDFTWSIGLVPDSATHTYSEVRKYSAGVADFSIRTTFVESLHLADYLNSIIPISIALWMSKSTEIKNRFGFLASPWMSILGVIAMFFTMSRSGWGALMVAVLMLAILMSPRIAFVHLPLATVATSLVAAVMVKLGFFASSATSLWAIVYERFDIQKIVMGPRAQYFLVLYESVKNNPVLGLGAGNFAVMAPSATESDAVHSAHGLLWAALADFGLLGFAALASFFGFIMYYLYKAIKRAPKKSPEQIVMTGLFAALSGLMFQALFVHDRPQFYLILLLGLAVVYSRHAISHKEDKVLKNI